MTRREKAIAALELRQPEGLVPTFELSFQLTEELMGRTHPRFMNWDGITARQRERQLHEAAEIYVGYAELLDHSIIMVGGHPGATEDRAKIIRLIKKMAGDEFLVITHGDATYGIPSGDRMMEFVEALAERPDEMKRQADARVDRALEAGKVLMDAGCDGFALCADYCFNSGPFLSPRMFAEFVTPYLARLIDGYRRMGAYTIKHTDGQIMPIIDQLVACRPHALHSLDPMAGVDIKVVKELYGDKVCLMGNVDCSLMQTGTEEELRESCRYALKHGMPRGGYVYSSSNCAFKGLPLERYMILLEERKKHGRYPEHADSADK